MNGALFSHLCLLFLERLFQGGEFLLEIGKGFAHACVVLLAVVGLGLVLCIVDPSLALLHRTGRGTLCDIYSHLAGKDFEFVIIHL